MNRPELVAARSRWQWKNLYASKGSFSMPDTVTTPRASTGDLMHSWPWRPPACSATEARWLWGSTNRHCTLGMGTPTTRASVLTGWLPREGVMWMTWLQHIISYGPDTWHTLTPGGGGT